MPLADKTAVVTGASEGIGLAISERLVREGAHVYLVARRTDALSYAVNRLGRRATAVRADISVISDIEALYASIAADGRRIDVLVANAGGGALGLLEDITEQDYSAIFDLNVRGTVFTVQKALTLLNDHASIILMGSIAASKGSPTYGLYSAAKAAIRSFARTWANELAPRHIRVNVISPGGIETASLIKTATMDGSDATEAIQRIGSYLPLGRVGHVDDIANAALFLATDQSSYITGTNITIDGGQSQQ